MNFYMLAEDEIQAIDILYTAGQYRHAVYHSCIAAVSCVWNINIHNRVRGATSSAREGN